MQWPDVMGREGRKAKLLSYGYAWVTYLSGYTCTLCVKGRTLTSYHTIQDDVRNAGGNWVDQEMVRDRNWVTSRSPKDLGAFNPAMISLFSEYKAKVGTR